MCQERKALSFKRDVACQAVGQSSVRHCPDSLVLEVIRPGKVRGRGCLVATNSATVLHSRRLMTLGHEQGIETADVAQVKQCGKGQRKVVCT